MCLPFSLAIVYGEHIASCAYVSCGQDKRRWILLLRLDVRFVFVIVEVGGQSYRAVIPDKYFLNFFSWHTMCRFLSAAYCFGRCSGSYIEYDISTSWIYLQILSI